MSAAGEAKNMGGADQPRPHCIETQAHATALLAQVDNIIFDCDGVIWTGDSPVPGAKKALERLQALGKKTIYVSNNATKRLDQYVGKFCHLGLPVPDEAQIMSSAVATAVYLSKELKPSGKGAYVIGEPGLFDTLESQGIPTVGRNHGDRHFDDFKKLGISDGATLAAEQNIGAVVVSFDGKINYFKLAYATVLLRSNPDILFVATNRDQASPLVPHVLVPGGGSMVSAVATAAGREPVLTGKPSQTLARTIIDAHGLDASRTLMVGDRLNTDIQFGKAGGFRTLLVLSGVSTQDDVDACSGTPQAPDYVTASIAVLSL